MSDQTSAGPTLNSTVREVQGVFPSDQALQGALSQLTLAGFDRADFSLPETQPSPGTATPDLAAANPHTDVDNRQIRNMTTGMAGTVGAFAAAAATVATGGAAALAAGAALAVGVGAGAAVNAVNQGADAVQHEGREAQARAGTLVLAVHVRDDAGEQRAMEILRAAGATRVEPVSRTDNVITAGNWTG